MRVRVPHDPTSRPSRHYARHLYATGLLRKESMYILESNPASDDVTNLRFNFVCQHNFHNYRCDEWMVTSYDSGREVVHLHCIVNASGAPLHDQYWKAFLQLRGVAFSHSYKITYATKLYDSFKAVTGFMFLFFRMLPLLYRLARLLVANILFMYVSLFFFNPEAASKVTNAVWDFLYLQISEKISEKFWSWFPAPFSLRVILLGAFHVPEFSILDSGATHNVAFELLPGDRYQSRAKVTLANGRAGDVHISAFQEVILDEESTSPNESASATPLKSMGRTIRLLRGDFRWCQDECQLVVLDPRSNVPFKPKVIVRSDTPYIATADATKLREMEAFVVSRYDPQIRTAVSTAASSPSFSIFSAKVDSFDDIFRNQPALLAKLVALRTGCYLSAWEAWEAWETMSVSEFAAHLADCQMADWSLDDESDCRVSMTSPDDTEVTQTPLACKLDFEQHLSESERAKIINMTFAPYRKHKDLDALEGLDVGQWSIWCDAHYPKCPGAGGYSVLWVFTCRRKVDVKGDIKVQTLNFPLPGQNSSTESMLQNFSLVLRTLGWNNLRNFIFKTENEFGNDAHDYVIKQGGSYLKTIPNRHPSQEVFVGCTVRSVRQVIQASNMPCSSWPYAAFSVFNDLAHAAADEHHALHPVNEVTMLSQTYFGKIAFTKIPNDDGCKFESRGKPVFCLYPDPYMRHGIHILYESRSNHSLHHTVVDRRGLKLTETNAFTSTRDGLTIRKFLNQQLTTSVVSPHNKRPKNVTCKECKIEMGLEKRQRGRPSQHDFGTGCKKQIIELDLNDIPFDILPKTEEKILPKECAANTTNVKCHTSTLRAASSDASAAADTHAGSHSDFPASVAPDPHDAVAARHAAFHGSPEYQALQFLANIKCSPCEDSVQTCSISAEEFVDIKLRHARLQQHLKNDHLHRMLFNERQSLDDDSAVVKHTQPFVYQAVRACLTQCELDAKRYNHPPEEYFLLAINVSVQEALQQNVPDWAFTINKEVSDLVEKGVLRLVSADDPDLKGMTLLPSLIVLTRKGENNQKKSARLVACGNFDLEEKSGKNSKYFSGTSELSLIKMLLLMYSPHFLSLVDVEKAFTQSSEEMSSAVRGENKKIALRLPSCFKHRVLWPECFAKAGYDFDKAKTIYLEVLRSVYGERSAPLAWKRSLEAVLTKLGFVRSSYDDSIYIKHIEGQLPQVCSVYVDDVWIFSQQQGLHDEFLRTLREHFQTTEPVHLHNGDTATFLAHDVAIKDGFLTFSQTSYIQQCREKSIGKFLTSEEAERPCTFLNPQHFDPSWLCASDDVSESDILSESDMTSLRGIVNTISYCSGSTRADLAAPLSVLARYQGGGRIHRRVLASAQNLLKYMFHTADLEARVPIDNFRFPSGTFAQYLLHCDFDASFGLDRSREGTILFLNGSYFGHRSKLQTTVSLSTTEAELTAASSAAKMLLGASNFLNELLSHYTTSHAPCPLMFGDCQAANQIASSTASVRKVRHLTLPQLYVRTLTESGRIAVKDKRTGSMTADMLTKVLAEQKVEYFRNLLGLRPKGCT